MGWSKKGWRKWGKRNGEVVEKEAGRECVDEVGGVGRRGEQVVGVGCLSLVSAGRVNVFRERKISPMSLWIICVGVGVVTAGFL